jgi:DUF4097 and DUF4098 domain-containing protein YvlB
MKAILRVLSLALCAPALAQTRVDERRPAAPDGTVEIENPTGSIRVFGWNRDEVQVTGTLGSRTGSLSFVNRPQRTRIQVEVEGNPQRVASELEIHVPAGSRLRVESFSAPIEVRDINGTVKAESVSGPITIAGNAREVDAETVSGALQISGPAKRVRASATSGPVTIRGASGAVRAESTNGTLDVSGGDFQEARLETVNGALRFDGGLLSGASLDVETVNGPIELRLPSNLGADFTISSYSGAIESDFEVRLGPGVVRGSHDKGRHRGRDDEHERDSEMRFTTGGGGAKVAITTLNGRIELRKR